MWTGTRVLGIVSLLIAAPRASNASAHDPDVVAAQTQTTAATPAPLTGTVALVHFKNEVGKRYRLVEASFILDGHSLPVLTNVGSGSDVPIFSGSVAPGRHVFTTRLEYRGVRRGPITYMRDYHLNVESRELLRVPDGRTVQFTISGAEIKGIDVPLAKQLGISVRSRLLRRGAVRQTEVDEGGH